MKGLSVINFLKLQMSEQRSLGGKGKLCFPPSESPFIHSSYPEESLCFEHCLPLENLCFTCEEVLLCTQCLSSQNHHMHDIRNLERSKQYLKNKISEWSIRL